MQTWLVHPGCGVWRDETGVRPVFRIMICFGLIYGIESALSTSIWFFIHLFSVFFYMLGLNQLTANIDPMNHGCIIVFNEFLSFVYLFLASLSATKIMAMFEGRSFWSYNLDLFRWKRKLFSGLIFGVIATAIIIGVRFFLEECNFIKTSVSFNFIFWDGLLSIVLTLLNTSGGNIVFWGYIQKTLSEQYGFYFSMFITAIVFSLVLIYSDFSKIDKENLLHVLSYFCVSFSFGILVCLAMRQTSSLWWSIGFSWGYFLLINFALNEYFVPVISNNSLMRNGLMAFNNTSLYHYFVCFICNVLFIFLMIIFRKIQKKNGNL